LLIAYISKTGNIERFVKKLPYENILKVEASDTKISEPFIFITYTTGIGDVPQLALDFCALNQAHLVAVASSGNINWGNGYGIAANKLSELYNVPILMKFELSGRPNDIEQFIKGVEELALHRAE